MNRTRSVVAGGLVGTGVMSLLFVLLEVQTRSAIGLFAVIARFVGLPGELYLGFFFYVVAGSVLWPLLFLALERYIPLGPDPAARGMVFGAVLWVPFVIVGRGDLTGPILVVYASFTLLAHLAYGFSMGAVYEHLRNASVTSTTAGGENRV